MVRILVVDDSPAVLKIIHKLLDDTYEVISADNGETAVKLATELRPDLILLDIIMPAMDGLAVCRYLKGQASTAEIPVIFITVISEPPNIVKAFEAGGQDYIVKPFSSQELCVRIKTHLELQESRKALKIYAQKLEAKNDELKKAMVKMEAIAATDYLTGLPNRWHVMRQIDEELVKIKHDIGTMTLALADINNFKQINDKYGHECGDKVLKQIANIMKANLRERDIVARWGGDEFLFILPDSKGESGHLVIDNIRAEIARNKVAYAGDDILVEMTFGMTQYEPSLDIDANIRAADAVLYSLKNR